MNLVLIGMPGSGKSTVGALLAARLELPLLDTDALVEVAVCRSIEEIFATDGEALFRALETAATVKAAEMKGAVIATGGGVVKRPENMEALARTGILFFLDRSPEALAAENHSGRPLIGRDRDKVFRLYDERIGLYRAYAQHVISGARSAAEAANAIIAIYKGEKDGR